MYHLDLDSSVPDWLIDQPELFSYFRQIAIDYSCGGKSLRTACRERGLNSETVLAECLARVQNPADLTASGSIPAEPGGE